MGKARRSLTSLLLWLLLSAAAAASDVGSIALPLTVDSSTYKVIDPNHLLTSSSRKYAETLLAELYTTRHVLALVAVVDQREYNDPGLADSIFSHYDIQPGDPALIAVISVRPGRIKIKSGSDRKKFWEYEDAIKNALKTNNAEQAVNDFTHALVSSPPWFKTDTSKPLSLKGKGITTPSSQSNVWESISNALLYGWDADNITLPHLEDSTRYVSNPEKILSAEAENAVNRIMRQMDTELGIESAVVIVNHVANRNIYEMAQGLFDKYGIGRNDRGLVIILAYQDHLIRTHTGKYLESDLPDIVCSRLQREYALPAMKKNNPDVGMINLTRAIYYTLKHEKVPNISEDPLLSDDRLASMFQDHQPKKSTGLFSRILDYLPDDFVKFIFAIIIILPFYVGLQIGKYVKRRVDEWYPDNSFTVRLFIIILMLVAAMVFCRYCSDLFPKDYFGWCLLSGPGGIIYGILGFTRMPFSGGSGDGSSSSGGGGYGGGGSGGGGASSSW